MSFMKEVIEYSIPVWDKCVNTPFVQEMKAGTLPLEKFKNYIVQDSIYLKHYARVYGMAIYNSNLLKDIQTYYSILGFVQETESAVRIEYLKQFGLTDDDVEHIKAEPENRAYIDFMLKYAHGGNIPEILMAVLPCMLSYGYISGKIIEEAEGQNSKYLNFIKDYSSEHYTEASKNICAFADAKCAGASEEEKTKLKEIFKEAGVLELGFWNMSYR
ncbi:thiaminase/transcriptional activator TenA [Elusimicrobium posterum]|uniref:thiaminase II n=1 Tax=Elusimicrobium posterum TaxID=3116653 RepID=UPI003C73D5DA